MESAIRVQILDEDIRVSLGTDAHEKDRNPSLFASVIGKYEGRLGASALLKRKKTLNLNQEYLA